MFYDTVNLYHETILKSKDVAIDAQAAYFTGAFFRIVEEFFSVIPPSMVATIDGKPMILLYAPTDYIANHALFDLAGFKAQFAESFGVEPYLIADINWDASKASVSEYRAGVDDWFSWSAALLPARYSPAFSSTASCAGRCAAAVSEGASAVAVSAAAAAARGRSAAPRAAAASAWVAGSSNGPTATAIQSSQSRTLAAVQLCCMLPRGSPVNGS